jgi:hypothetical protein
MENLKDKLIQPFGKLLEAVEAKGYDITLSYDGWRIMNPDGTFMAGNRDAFLIARASNHHELLKYRDNQVMMYPWLHLALLSENQ